MSASTTTAPLPLPTPVTIKQFLAPECFPTIRVPPSSSPDAAGIAFRIPLNAKAPELAQIARWFHEHGVEGDVEVAVRGFIALVQAEARPDQTHMLIHARMWQSVPQRPSLRWHSDGMFWPSLADPSKTQLKYGCVLAGSPTLCLNPAQDDLFTLKEANMKIADASCLPKDRDPTSDEIQAAQARADEIDEEVNLDLTRKMASVSTTSATRPGQCAKWVIGGDSGTYHSEPWNESLRAFVACTPGTAEQLNSLNPQMFI